MTVTFSRYVLVWERTLGQSSHTTEWARTLRFGAGLLVPLQGAAAGCRCKVLLSECCVGYGAGLLCSCRGAAAGCRFKVLQSAVCALEPAGALQPLLVLLKWQASPGAVQGAKLLFIFPLRFQDQKGLGGLVCLSASFWPRFGLVLAASFFAYATVAVVLRAA